MGERAWEELRELARAAFESTCQKRVTVCAIFDAGGDLLAAESNRCEPGEASSGKCTRLMRSDEREAYPLESDCNWTHAEIMAVRSLTSGRIPYRAVIFGHDWPCPACELALFEAGVEKIEVEPARRPDVGIGLRAAP